MRSCVLLAILLAFCGAVWGQGKFVELAISMTLIDVAKPTLISASSEEHSALICHWLALLAVGRKMCVLTPSRVCSSLCYYLSGEPGCFVCKHKC